MSRKLLLTSILGIFSLILSTVVEDAEAISAQKRQRVPLTASALGSVCSSIVPIQLLVKTTAGGHITAGPRVTGYSVVCSRKQCISGSKGSFYYSDGTLAGQVGYYGKWVGNGQKRFYGGTGGAPQHFASRIAKNAKKLADKRLFLNLNSGGRCVAFNATGRTGSPF